MSYDAFDYPTIRIDIEGVRRTLIQHLGASLEREKEQIARQVNEQLADVNFSEMVRLTIEKALPEVMAKSVRDAVERVTTELLYSTEVEEQLRVHVKQAFAASIAPKSKKKAK